MQWKTPLELTMLGAIWGSSFLFMRIGAGEFGPIGLVQVRLTLGALILLPFLWRERRRIDAALRWKLVGIGVVNCAVPFTLFAWGAERAPASIGAICNALTVLFAALIAFLVYRERIGPRQWTGMLCGFLGVLVLARGWRDAGEIALAAAAGTAAALFYGLGVNLIRRHVAGVPASAVAAATLLAAALLLAPFAVWQWPRHTVAPGAWLSAVLLGVLCTGIAFVLYYRLISRIGAPRAATVTYLTPLFAVIWAWLALGERPTRGMLVSGALILGGVALSQTGVSGRGSQRSWLSLLPRRL